jgi:hypothetical protein
MVLPVGDYEIVLAYMGYEETVRKIKLVSPGQADFEIFEKSVNLSEVTITSIKANRNISSTQMSMVKLDSREIKELPISIGEVDLLKSIPFQIQSVNSGGFFVRWWCDQNLILLKMFYLCSSPFGLTSY